LCTFLRALCLARDEGTDREWLVCDRLTAVRWLRVVRLSAALAPLALNSTSDATLAASRRVIRVVIAFLSLPTYAAGKRRAAIVPPLVPKVDGGAGVR
jgi:hypothetical protein